MFVVTGCARKYTIQASSLNIIFGVPRGKKTSNDLLVETGNVYNNITRNFVLIKLKEIPV
jgi:hypothetical protein